MMGYQPAHNQPAQDPFSSDSEAESDCGSTLSDIDLDGEDTDSEISSPEFEALSEDEQDNSVQ